MDYVKNYKASNLYLLLPILFITILNLNRFFTSINPALHILTFLIGINFIFIFLNIDFRYTKFRIYPSVILFITTILFYLVIGSHGTIPKNNVGIILAVLQNIGMILMLLIIVNNVNDYKKVLSTITYAGILLGILGILQFLDLFSVMELVGSPTLFYGNRIGSTWINPNQYALVLVFSIIISFELENNVISFIGKFIMIIGIIVSSSRSAVLISGIILLLNILFKNKKSVKKREKFKKIILGVIIIFVFIHVAKNETIRGIIDNSRIDRVFSFKDSNSNDISNGRIGALANSVDIVKENFIAGIGIKNIPGYSNVTQSAHNMYINIWAESGIIPFLLYIFFNISLLTIVKVKSRLFKYNRLTINLFLMLIGYGFFSHTLLTNPITGILTGIIILKSKLMSKKS